MAKADEANSDGKKGDGPGTIASVAVCLLVGATAGAGFGFVMLPKPIGGVAALEAGGPHANANEKSNRTEPSGRFPNDAVEIVIPPIITTIGADQKANVRLDLSMIAIHGTAQETPLKSEVREDIIAFLRGLTLDDLEGARGFLNLRAQLDERARVRGRGVILGLLVGGLIIQ